LLEEFFHTMNEIVSAGRRLVNSPALPPIIDQRLGEATLR
jgi:hypothetical protein